MKIIGDIAQHALAADRTVSAGTSWTGPMPAAIGLWHHGKYAVHLAPHLPLCPTCGMAHLTVAKAEKCCARIALVDAHREEMERNHRQRFTPKQERPVLADRLRVRITELEACGMHAKEIANVLSVEDDGAVRHLCERLRIKRMAAIGMRARADYDAWRDRQRKAHGLRKFMRGGW